MFMEKIKVKIQRVHPDARVPIYGSAESTGFDVYSIEDKMIAPGGTVMIRTGIKTEIQPGYCFLLWDRSGMGVKGIHRFAGVIDSDYRGEWKVILHNHTTGSYDVKKGDRIIQAVISYTIQAEFEEVSDLGETIRGEGGFHSTGK